MDLNILMKMLAVLKKQKNIQLINLIIVIKNNEILKNNFDEPTL